MKCDQMKCAFNIMGGCQTCEMCGAKPHDINDNCDICWNCKSDEGAVRWGSHSNKEKEEIAEAEKTKKQEKLLEVVAR